MPKLATRLSKSPTFVLNVRLIFECSSDNRIEPRAIPVWTKGDYAVPTPALHDARFSTTAALASIEPKFTVSELIPFFRGKEEAPATMVVALYLTVASVNAEKRPASCRKTAGKADSCALGR